MSIKISSAPCCWGVDNVNNPYLPKWERVLEEASLAGYRGIELGPYGYIPLNAEVVGQAFRDAVMPVLATPGNHDWCFPGQDDSVSGRRKFSKVLVPVTRKTPAFTTRHLAGVTFAAIDNASRRVTRDQARQASKLLAEGGPVVLMMHIPVTLPTLREPARLKLGEVDLMNDPDLAPAAERDLGDDDATALLVDAMVTAPNLLAVVCGHLHLGREDSLSPSCVQIVVPPGCRDGHRLLRFEPW